jgi:hypothetical protein
MNTIVYKGIFMVMPLTVPPLVYDMSSASGQSRTKATVSVAGKTYTDEELEYMAAMEAADNFNIPNAELLALAETSPPPPEWFKRIEKKPF